MTDASDREGVVSAVADAPVFRTARKEHRCANASRADRGVAWAQVCQRTIAKGERYLEGEMDLDYAGGFGKHRYCTACAEAGLA